ncbi:recombinase family protein [Oceanobacillus luteolus]|uniref:recombinase family protein n=1 Tax=Oceanobacillus luteolus TaxID=1274358 RepID=UPI00203D863D|nr:recombinase family protein [Oceanobacillus luteolus]MCM3741609.1 recombinase family protein [Oceanobacillus luteolus]
MIYGYVRPLYNDLKSEAQLKALPDSCDVIFKEEHGSPKKRLQLENLLMELQPGDSILVEKMVALADTFHHLMELLKVCEKDRVTIHFLSEGIRSDELLQMTLQDILVHVIQFQSDAIRQSTSIGMDQARKSGKSIGRPKKSDENVKKAIAMYHDGFKLIDIKNETGISKSTLYRYLESMESE